MPDGRDSPEAFSSQRSRVLQVIDKVAQKALDEGVTDPVNVAFKRICAKADVKTSTMDNRGYKYTLDEKMGLEYVKGKGIIRITPGKWKELRENRGEWTQRGD